MKKITSFALAAGLIVSACGTNPQTGQGTFNRTDVATVVGGVAGAFLGGQFGDGRGKTIASIAGGLAGAWAGRSIANHLTLHDQAQYRQAETVAHSAPVGETVEWFNPESGNQGTITPTREGQSTAGRYCREYQQTVTIGGQTEEAYGQACRQPDGSWEIVS